MPFAVHSFCSHQKHKTRDKIRENLCKKKILLLGPWMIYTLCAKIELAVPYRGREIVQISNNFHAESKHYLCNYSSTESRPAESKELRCEKRWLG